ncbi:hypothetical protein E8E13_000284 [Curvularia kusanoi]|uniref:Uncharacterized protein n=1 Tax=Curvularia kusanoi TaxID=90978 RepID=A0A9P4T4R6_CURKU|nr:hypothetical protein E8E13_000284 [Curvularia kusanoi]
MSNHNPTSTFSDHPAGATATSPPMNAFDHSKQNDIAMEQAQDQEQEIHAACERIIASLRALLHQAFTREAEKSHTIADLKVEHERIVKQLEAEHEHVVRQLEEAHAATVAELRDELAAVKRGGLKRGSDDEDEREVKRPKVP